MDKLNLKKAVALTTPIASKIPLAAEIAKKQDLNSLVSQEAQFNYRRKITLIEAVNNWDKAVKAFTEGRKNYLEKKTLDGYLVLLKTFTDWLKEMELLDITPGLMSDSVIEEYLNYCISARGNSKGTANSKLVALKIFYTFMVEKKLMEHNPTDGIKKFKNDEPPIYSFTPEQLKKIFGIIPDTWRGARDNSIYRMIVETGCRVDEALNIGIRDTIFSNGIPIRLLFKETKNHKPREVSVTPKLAEAYLYWLNKRHNFGVSNEIDMLHIGLELKPINIRTVQKNFLEYCQLAGIDKEGVRCSPYTLKHTFCKLFLLGGGSVNALREIVGHIDNRSISKYVRATAKEAGENHLSFAPSQVYEF